MKKWIILPLLLTAVAITAYYQNNQIRSFVDRQFDEALPETMTHNKAYRWRDSEGNIHISDQPPAEGIKYEEVEYHRETNVIPAEKLTGKSNN